MIEGALIALAGVIVGRFLPGRRRKKGQGAVCGCKHSIGYHEGKTGRCFHVSGFDGNDCTCQHYDGPIPVESFFSTPMLPPGEA